MYISSLCISAVYVVGNVITSIVTKASQTILESSKRIKD